MEDNLQAEIIKYFWNNRPDERGLLFHVNNKARNKIEGNKMKALGTIAGVSDLIYLKPHASPIMIELKTQDGKQSIAQIAWQELVHQAGYRYEVVRSLDEFKKLIS